MNDNAETAHGGRPGAGRVAGYVWDLRARAIYEVVVRRHDGRLVAVSRDELGTSSRPRRRTRDASRLIPEDPRDAGLLPVGLNIEQVEPAHMLANEAREELRSVAFTNDEIDGWAREFVAQRAAGDAGDLMAWIRLEEQRSP